MSGINKVVLVGRLTRDVEVKKTQSGISVASYTVAVDRRFQSGNGPTADFINCVSWRQSADFLGTYGRKGAMVGVEGSIQTRNYTANDGRKVYVTEVVTDAVQLLESKAQTQSRMDQGASYGDASYSAPNYSNQSNEPAYNIPTYDGQEELTRDDFNTGPSLDIASDDLPF